MSNKMLRYRVCLRAITMKSEYGGVHGSAHLPEAKPTRCESQMLGIWNYWT